METSLHKLIQPLVDSLYAQGVLDAPFSKVAYLVDDVTIKVSRAATDVVPQPIPMAKKNTGRPDMERTVTSMGARSKPMVAGAVKNPGAGRGAQKVRTPK